jgi:alpha-maltose-1-phosphate synthase
MNITISSPTRFHLYGLGAELARKGHTIRLLTAGTRKSVPAELRPAARCAPWLGAFVLGSRLVDGTSLQRGIDWQLVRRFDEWASRHVTPSDVTVALSGRGLATLIQARIRESLAVCDRGSTHIEYQDAILRDEFARWGYRFGGVDPRGIDRELEEYQTADLITVPSLFSAETYVERGIAPEKIAVVPYGIDPTPFVSIPSEATPDVFRVLFVGRLSLRKGLPYLLLASQRLSREIRGFELCLVGGADDEVRPLLSSLGRSIVATGHLSGKDLLRAYKDASAFVLPSIEEGLATVLLQAMAAGVPVIATVNTGAGDLVTDGREGFLIAPRSSDAIEAGVLALHEDRERCRSMGAAARRRVQEYGALPSYASRALAAYSQGLQRRKAS